MRTCLALTLLLVGGIVAFGQAPLFLPREPPVKPADKADDEKLTPKQADEKYLKSKKISTEPAELLAYLKGRNLDAKALDAAAAMVKKLGDDDYFVREKASDDLQKRGPGIVPLLRRALSDPDEEVKDRARTLLLTLEGKTNPTTTLAVLRLVRANAPDGAVPVLFDYLPVAESDAVEDEALNTLAVLGVKDGKVNKLLQDALDDSQVTRRAAAGLVLGRSGTAEQKKAVQALLTDADAVVRFRAAQGLLAGKDRAGVPVLCTLVGDGPLVVGTRAEELLQCLAGTQPPKTPPFADDATVRKKSRQAWEEWWKANGKMDLSKAEVELPPFNLALRSRAVLRQFGTALAANDVEAMKKLVDKPFLVYGNQLLKTRDEVLRYIESNNLPERGQQSMPIVLARIGLDKYPTAANLQPVEKDFPAGFAKGELRAYNVYFQNNPNINPNPGEEFTIYVRSSGDQVKVVGFGQPRQRVGPGVLDSLR